MLVIGHIALGYVASLVVTKLLFISPSSDNYAFLITLCVLASIIPDIDFLLFFYENKSLKLQREDSHRKYLTHLPIFWIICSAIVFIIGELVSNNLAIYSSIFMLVGSFSHLAGDSVEYGIKWFWPFSNKQYIIHKIPMENFKANEPLATYYWKFFSQIYIKNWTFYLELIFVIIAMVLFM